MANPSGTSPSRIEPASVEEAPIFHVDLDAFFASVEILDDPTLIGRPVAVGGAGDRGVIASASYEARRYGVRSAMPTVVARRRCPGLVILPGRFERYDEYSRRFHRIVEELTPVVEPLGLDEVFADVSSLRRLDVRPVAAAHELRRRIRDELSIDAGIGVARNKLFAKLGSKRSKPVVIDGSIVPGAGVVYVSPEMERRWLDELPVRALWGVGPATAERLGRLGVSSVRELSHVPEGTLRAHFGPAMGHALAEMAKGRDARAVEADRAAKSIGSEETYAVSVTVDDRIAREARRHGAIVARALRGSDQVARTVSVTLRFDDMSSTGRSQTLPFGVDDDEAVGDVATALVATIERRGAVRLLGVSASTLAPRDHNQVQLAFELERAGPVDESRSHQARRAALNDAIDDLRRRFGRSAIGSGLDLGRDGLRVGTQRGDHAFGPSGDESDTHRP
jgi:DNA polymerase-4